MKFTKKLMALVLVFALAAAMSSFALAEGAIKIGVIGPLTGGAALYGIGVRDAALIAMEEINALGGLQIEIKAEDDVNDPVTSLNAYNSVMEWGAQMICGTVTSKPCVEVGTTAFEERVFMLTPSASSDEVTNGKDNVYQICFTDPNQGAASAQYIADHQLASKVAIIYNNGDVYSTGIFQTFKAKAAELGLTIVSETTFPDDSNVDFSFQVSDAKDKGAELVFLPIYYTPASLILQTADSMDYHPIFFGVDGMDGILDIEGFDTSLAEGLMLLTPFSATAEDEATQSFVEKFVAKNGGLPNQFAADAYDAIYVLYNACLTAGITPETSPEDACELLIATMQELSYDGLTGSMTWDASGAVTKTPMAAIIQNGEYVLAD